MQKSKQVQTKEDIVLVLKNILSENCGVEKDLSVGPELLPLRFIEDLELDSMGLLALTAEVENHFRIFLQEDSLRPPQTVGEVVDLIWFRVQEQEVSREHKIENNP